MACETLQFSTPHVPPPGGWAPSGGRHGGQGHGVHVRQRHQQRELLLFQCQVRSRGVGQAGAPPRAARRPHPGPPAPRWPRRRVRPADVRGGGRSRAPQLSTGLGSRSAMASTTPRLAPSTATPAVRRVRSPMTTAPGTMGTWSWRCPSSTRCSSTSFTRCAAWPMACARAFRVRE